MTLSRLFTVNARMSIMEQLQTALLPARSRGEWFPKTFFQTCGASSTGPHNSWPGSSCHSCSRISKPVTLISRESWGQRWLITQSTTARTCSSVDFSWSTSPLSPVSPSTGQSWRPLHRQHRTLGVFSCSCFFSAMVSQRLLKFYFVHERVCFISALVEVPRSLYNNSKPGYTLQHAYFKLSKLSSDKAEAEETAEDVLESLQSLNIIIPTHHPTRPFVEEILKKVPTELMEKAKRSIRAGDGGAGIPSEKALIRLHRQVIKSLQVLQRTEALWNVQVEKILYLEDVEMNFLSSPPFRHDLSLKTTPVVCTPKIRWYWECVIKSPFLKMLAGLTAAMSIVVVWSELTFFSSHPVLSIFANILNIAKHSYDFTTIEIFSMATLCYLCYCAYSTIFRIKFLNLYYLAPHHQTNEHSLIFSGMLLCRLTPPMCLNFLGLMHMDSHIIKTRVMETFYTQIMGHMDVLGIIANGFNIYFPMVMLAFCAATWFSLGSRILNALGFQQFMANDEISSELVQEGRDLMVREKRKRQRNDSALSRRRDLASRDSNTNTAAANFRGLLREGSTGVVGYNTNGNTDELSPDYGRSLSQEISARFGASTDVGFRPDFDDEIPGRATRPRNIFDDV